MDKLSIFVINLKKDVDKKEHIQQLGEKYGLCFSFIDAVFGKNLSSKYLNTVYDRNKAILTMGRELTLGEIGCALSHMDIYKKMIHQGIDQAVILEDDVIFDKKLLDVVNKFDRFPSDWECLLLHYHRNSHLKRNYCLSFYGRKKIGGSFKIIRFIKPMHSTAGYMINRPGAQKLLNILSNGIYQPIDHYTGDEKYINLYGILPRIVDIDPKFGLQTSLDSERVGVYVNDIENKNIIKQILKKIGLFSLAKKINYFRMTKFAFIGQVFYIIKNIKSCFKKPKNYS